MTTDTIERQRRLILADHIEQLQPDQLDMNTWARSADTSDVAHDLTWAANIFDNYGDCGTVACAAGWAVHIFDLRSMHPSEVADHLGIPSDAFIVSRWHRVPGLDELQDVALEGDGARLAIIDYLRTTDGIETR